jgi:AmiR/NasT family two-component response regulator
VAPPEAPVLTENEQLCGHQCQLRAAVRVMERRTIDEQHAYELLREHSPTNNRKLLDLVTA